jgi:mono/diheme cytochrome c family protein
MLSTIDLVVAGLSTGHKIGLAAVGIAFIVFALVSSFVLTRRDPDFPGKKGLGWYVVLCIAFFVAMIAAVLVFGKESKEATGPGAATTTASSTAPAATTTAAAATTTTAVQGDPAAGKAVFASAGCNGCHTLKAAGATGTVGPNLDDLKPAYDRIVHQVEVGGGPMPAFKGRLSDADIHNVAAFVYTSTHS